MDRLSLSQLNLSQPAVVLTEVLENHELDHVFRHRTQFLIMLSSLRATMLAQRSSCSWKLLPRRCSCHNPDTHGPQWLQCLCECPWSSGQAEGKALKLICSVLF